MRLPGNTEKIEVHTYSVIAPVLFGTEKGQNEYFRKLSAEGIKIPPDSENVYYLKVSTLKGWLRKYRKFGLEGLKQKERSDKGKFKKISEKVVLGLEKVIEDKPPVSVADLYYKLIASSFIKKEELSYEALRNYVRSKGIFKKVPQKERKKFEKEFPNQLWMIDFKHGKSIRQNKVLKGTYLCAIIDDSSRILVGYEWGFNEDTSLFARTLKKAISIYGLPEILYCDRGSVYIGLYITELCGKLGIALCHTDKQDPEAKAKIERFNRTIGQMFYPLVKDFKQISILELNQAFTDFIDKIYHTREHGTLKEAPLSKFQRLLPEIKIRRLRDSLLEEYFLASLKRRVRLDGTIRINNRFYEVNMTHVQEYIEVKFNLDRPFDFFFENKKLKEVNLVENANRPFINTSYSKLLKGEK